MRGIDAPGPGRRERQRRIVLFAGTRPEAIKLAPVALAGRGADDLRLVLIHSGQHDALFADGLAPFGLEPDLRLAVAPAGSPDDAVAQIRGALLPRLREIAPDMVVVQGDTSSALAGALASHDLGIPLAHVEAGLRSGDPALPWPEEGNRIAISRIADLNFAPSPRAADNLRQEGARGCIHVTGNPGIDALLQVRKQVAPRGCTPGTDQQILVTAHRREIIGAPLARVAAALRLIAAGGCDRQITVLLHTNPAGRQLRDALAGVPGIELLPAAGFAEMVARLSAAALVLSDSGGLQEECSALGVPLLILRDNTERPEVIEAGAARLVGTDTRTIVGAAERVLAAAGSTPTAPCFPYGEGDAAGRIIDILGSYPFPPA